MQQQQPGSNFNPYAPPTADIHQDVQSAFDGEYVLADRGARFVAVLLDLLLAMAPGLVTFAAVATSIGRGGTHDVVTFSLLALSSVAGLALVGYQWYLISTTGQSIAKRWMGIKIVRIDDSPLGFVHGVILRSWVIGLISAIPFLGAIIALVGALMIFGEQRRCLHDYIAGTRVIVAPSAE